MALILDTDLLCVRREPKIKIREIDEDQKVGFILAHPLLHAGGLSNGARRRGVGTPLRPGAGRHGQCSPGRPVRRSLATPGFSA